MGVTDGDPNHPEPPLRCEICKGVGRVKFVDGVVIGPADGFDAPELVIDCPSCAGTSPNKPEPDPEPNDSRPIWELVVEDMNERHQEGIRKYGVPLQAFNGRKPLIDAYQEALDLAVYLRQAIEEQKLAETGERLVFSETVEGVGFTFYTSIDDDGVPYAEVSFDGKLVGRTSGARKENTLEAFDSVDENYKPDIPQTAKDKGWAAVGCTECGGPAPADDMAELYKFDGKCRGCYEKGRA